MSFFFFNDTATTEIYTLSLHDALPISQLHLDGDRHAVYVRAHIGAHRAEVSFQLTLGDTRVGPERFIDRSEEHTSELQSQSNLVCRLLLEKKKYREHTTVHTS